MLSSPRWSLCNKIRMLETLLNWSLLEIVKLQLKTSCKRTNWFLSKKKLFSIICFLSKFTSIERKEWKTVVNMCRTLKTLKKHHKFVDSSPSLSLALFSLNIFLVVRLSCNLNYRCFDADFILMDLFLVLRCAFIPFFFLQ